MAYNWRLHWEPQTRGGYDVIYVKNDRSQIVGVFETTSGGLQVKHYTENGLAHDGEETSIDLIPRTPPTGSEPHERIQVALDFAEEHGFPVQPEDRDWIERMARLQKKVPTCDYCHSPATRGKIGGWTCQPCGAVYGRRGWRFLGEYDS